MTEMKRKHDLKPERNYKARLFEMIFREKKELLNLYNAVNHTNYTDPDELEINTLENAIYLSMKNDLSFVIGSRVSLYEQQSTYNPNLPLRYLFYIADLYSEMIRADNLYGSKLLKIPTPHFVVFYNGESERPEKDVLKLSDAFSVKEKRPMLELKAEFLSKNRAEAMKMSIYEYDEERQRILDREEGMELECERYSKLVMFLLEENKSEDLLKAAKDREYLKSLYTEYGI